MGQRASTQRIFGYFDQPDTTTSPQGTLQDRVLALPDYYGLLSTPNLAHDLAYIDATYYCDANDTSQASAKEHKKAGRRHDTRKCDTDKLTFGDIEHLVQERKLRLHSRALVGLDNDILYLRTVTKLDLSRNQLTHLPDAFGSLTQLTHIILSHNRISQLPHSIHGLVELTELDVSHNPISALTPYIGHLKKLRVLDLSSNRDLTELPIEMGGLVSLSTLYLHKCPLIHHVPAELLRLPNLRRIRIDPPTQLMHDSRHNPPSLLELCARQAYASTRTKNDADLQWVIDHRLNERPKPCSACGQPYFTTYVSRLRLEERPDGTMVLYQYRLCSDHWAPNDDQDRRLYMFSASLPREHNVLRFLPLPSAHPNSSSNSTSTTSNNNTISSKANSTSSSTTIPTQIMQQNDNSVVDANKAVWKQWLRSARSQPVV